MPVETRLIGSASDDKSLSSQIYNWFVLEILGPGHEH